MTEVEKLYTKLQKFYGPQNWWPVHPGQDRITEIVVGAVLTQNTSWKNVEKALENLIKADCLKFEKIVAIPEAELVKLIKPAGFYTRKSRVLKDLSELFLKNKKPSREELLSIKGIGKETADSILLYALEEPYFVVDTYTKRLFYRLDFCDEKITYDNLQKLIANSIPADIQIYKEFHALIVEHCKNFCKKKPVCNNCPLDSNCQYFDKIVECSQQK